MRLVKKPKEPPSNYALVEGRLDPDDPKAITVKWYKHLLEIQQLIKDLEIGGRIL